MENNDNLDLFLKSVKEVIDTIGKNYADIFFQILTQNSEYDKLFYEYAKRNNVFLDNLKKRCINYILSFNNKSNNFQFSKEDIVLYFEKEYINDKNNSFEDIYTLIDNYIRGCNKHEIINIITQKDQIKDLKLLYGVTKKEQSYYVLSYIISTVYEVIKYSSNLKQDDNTPLSYLYQYLDFENFDMDYFIETFKENSDLFLDIYDVYVNLDKRIVDYIHKYMIREENVGNLFEICPIIVPYLRKYYDFLYLNEEIDSIRIGTKTINIINNVIKDFYNDIYKIHEVYPNILFIIKSYYKEENLDEWFMYLISNVYQNIKFNKEEKYYDLVNNIEYDIKQILKDDNMLIVILKLFYRYNADVFDEETLKELNKSVSLELVKKINPYYGQEKRYLN